MTDRERDIVEIKVGGKAWRRRGHKTADTRDTFSSILLAHTFALLSGAAAGCFSSFLSNSRRHNYKLLLSTDLICVLFCLFFDGETNLGLYILEV